MVRGLSRDKFGAVNCYSGKFSARWLAVTPIFTHTIDFRFYSIIFPGNTWRTFRASGIFGLKTVDIQDTKKPTEMVQVEFLKIQNQVRNKRVNPNSNFPCIKKTQMFAQIIWCISEHFKCFSKIRPSQQIERCYSSGFSRRERRYLGPWW